MAESDREILLRQMREARTLEEIEAAREAQRQWLLQHSDDLEVLFNGEQLAMMESALKVGREAA